MGPATSDYVSSRWSDLFSRASDFPPRGLIYFPMWSDLFLKRSDLFRNGAYFSGLKSSYFIEPGTLGLQWGGNIPTSRPLAWVPIGSFITIGYLRPVLPWVSRFLSRVNRFRG